MAKRNQKSETCSNKSRWCDHHLMILTPQTKDLYLKKQLKLRLCPKFNQNSKLFQKVFPEYLNDKKYYTPSFVLQQQHKHFNDNDQIVKKNHSTKVEIDDKVNRQTFSDIMIARHVRKINYCAVCRDEYEDYLDHIESLSHKNYIQKNKFNRYIQQLCQFFQKTNPNKIELKQTKEETIKQNEQITWQSMGQPRKMVKKQ